VLGVGKGTKMMDKYLKVIENEFACTCIVYTHVCVCVSVYQCGGSVM
jgi:hypothetical protein